jgi:predicted dehydrogenase
VLHARQAGEIEKFAFEKGLFVGVEYHKRLDDRNLLARQRYRQGLFGEFRVGQAHLMEPWYYRHSNFQNWCTIENSDPFTYIGCHYIDLVHFITGLLPTEVSVVGMVERFPNGNRAFMWSDGRVLWENGACLNVINGFGYPDAGAGSNAQGMRLFCSGKEDGGLIDHHDQFRGVKHSHAVKDPAFGDKQYHEINPDYFQMVDIGGKGLKPVGYGYRSIELLINAILQLEQATARMNPKEALKKRKELLKTIDREAMIATPANSAYNELVIEAGRLSILNGGRPVTIEYGERPKVRFKAISEFPIYAEPKTHAEKND